MGIIKEFISELKRYRTDKKVNGEKYTLLKSVHGAQDSNHTQDGQNGNKLNFAVSRCESIQVGDIIELKDD